MFTIFTGLAVPQVGYNAFATAVPLLDKMVVVKEEWIALAILRLVEQEKCKQHHINRHFQERFKEINCFNIQWWLRGLAQQA